MLTRLGLRQTAGALFLCLALHASCTRPEQPVFSLAWSEYPSWSFFGVAHDFGLLDGAAGSLGSLEHKWNVDVVLKEADYESSIVMYGSGQVDAVTITNMDVLNPSLSRPSVAVLPTSTSAGADALVVTDDIKSVQDLRGRRIHGLAKSVSEYMFARNIEMLGEQDTDFVFSNMDPGAAALAMQQQQPGFAAIAVWNPFLLETLKKRKDVRVLFDSTSIPGEILDLLVVSERSLERPYGQAFARVLVEAFYAVNERLAEVGTRDATLAALGRRYSQLDARGMTEALRQTHVFAGPKDGIAALDRDILKPLMDRVIAFCVRREMVPKAPTLGYGPRAKSPSAVLQFDPEFMEAALRKKPSP